MSEIAFLDWETRSLADVTVCGAYKYAKEPSTDVLVLGYAFDDDDCKIWSPAYAWGNTVCSTPDEYEPIDLIQYVADGGLVVAWNAFFDRWIWNCVMVPKYGWPVLNRNQVLCAQAQAEANNLPGGLAKAAECLGTYHKKDPAGKRLIGQLCSGTRDNWNSQIFETPAKMGHFRAYCAHDVMSMRDIWQHTRPLYQGEWNEYHANERINDRGVEVDAEFAAHAMQYAATEFADINGQLAELTGDKALTLNAHLRKARWLFDELWPAPELQEIVKRPDKKKTKPDGTEIMIERFSCDRPTREAVLEMILQPEYAELFEENHAQEVIEFIELIEAGNSAAVRKFTAICNQEIAGRIHGQYSFNGAGQTGRFSSRGVQIHNLIRDPVAKKNPNRALDAIDRILAGAEPDDLVAEFGYPVSRLLARLIRPTFIAPDGRQLVWADWDQIEGRCLPWLAASPQSEAKLDLYRQGHDTYKLAAMPIFGLSAPADATDKQRQVGKVAELALGFGGAVGAFTAMGRGYGVHVPNADARRIVDTWRAMNAWAPHFWHELWEAALDAFKNPGTWWAAGRVSYLYHPTLMRGTLICRLPDGRWIVYPQFKHEYVEYEAKKDTAIHKKGEWVKKWQTSCMKSFQGGSARVELWYGTLAENITQATAASFLRRAIVELQSVIVLHTHDELVAECDDSEVRYVRERMQEAMTYLPDWAAGLPLSVTVESGPFYTK